MLLSNLVRLYLLCICSRVLKCLSIHTIIYFLCISLLKLEPLIHYLVVALDFPRYLGVHLRYIFLLLQGYKSIVVLELSEEVKISNFSPIIPWDISKQIDEIQEIFLPHTRWNDINVKEEVGLYLFYVNFQWKMATIRKDRIKHLWYRAYVLRNGRVDSSVFEVSTTKDSIVPFWPYSIYFSNFVRFCLKLTTFLWNLVSIVCRLFLDWTSFCRLFFYQFYSFVVCLAFFRR